MALATIPANEHGMTSFELTTHPTEDGDLAVLDVVGELDLTNAFDFEEQLDDLTAGRSKLVLDLNRVYFIDSAGLHVLFRLARRLGRSRFGIVLEPSASIARTLAVASVPDVATLRGSVEDTLAALEA